MCSSSARRRPWWTTAPRRPGCRTRRTRRTWKSNPTRSATLTRTTTAEVREPVVPAVCHYGGTTELYHDGKPDGGEATDREDCWVGFVGPRGGGGSRPPERTTEGARPCRRHRR